MARQQVVGLEDEAEGAAAQTRASVLGEAGDIPSAEGVLARARPVEQADDVHQSALAGARLPPDRDELPAPDVEAHA